MVLNDGDLNQVTWEQRVMEGDPKFEASQDIPSVPYHKFAEVIGIRDFYVNDAEAIAAVWRSGIRIRPPSGDRS